MTMTKTWILPTLHCIDANCNSWPLVTTADHWLVTQHWPLTIDNVKQMQQWQFMQSCNCKLHFKVFILDLDSFMTLHCSCISKFKFKNPQGFMHFKVSSCIKSHFNFNLNPIYGLQALHMCWFVDPAKSLKCMKTSFSMSLLIRNPNRDSFSPSPLIPSQIDKTNKQLTKEPIITLIITIIIIPIQLHNLTILYEILLLTNNLLLLPSLSTFLSLNSLKQLCLINPYNCLLRLTVLLHFYRVISLNQSY